MFKPVGLERRNNMHPIRRILVAIKEPGAVALPAVAKAARIAHACGAQVELFYALEASVSANTADAYDAAVRDICQTQRQHYLQRLGRIAARLRLHGIQVSTAVEYDYPPHDAIVRRARLINADLVVARRNSRRRAIPGLFRGTDWELLRRSPAPVLLVRESGAYRHPNVLAAVDPSHAHSKPLQLDEEILSAGMQLTKALKGKLYAVHAYAPVVVGSAAASISATAAARLERSAAADAGREFDRLSASTGIPKTRRYLVGNFPASAINEVARRVHAHIVVVGAVSRSGVKGLIIGNTAEGLMEELPCDLLVLKPAQFVCPVSSESNGLRLLARADRLGSASCTHLCG
jgi:universal stress protein E